VSVSERIHVPVIQVKDARAALAILASVFYGKPSSKIRVIGITGTNGKTTCSYLLEHLLKALNQKVGVIGTINYRYGQKVIPATQTTPGPLQLQKILSQMQQSGCSHAILEVSSHALHQKRTQGIDFEVGLFTNLTQDHLDYHDTLENYFEAKSQLFKNLASDKTSVINMDNPWVSQLAEAVRSRVLTYGIEKPAKLQARVLELGLENTHLLISHGSVKIDVRVPLGGLHNIYNVLGSLAVMISLGFNLKECCRSLTSFSGVPGRLESVRCGQNFLVFVDYAHTPDGLENVLSSLATYKTKRMITIFGCGGDRDRDKRSKMGRVAGRFSDFIYITSDNPRSEDPKKIAGEIQAGLPDEYRNVAIVPDRRKAIRQALLAAKDGDIVLLAGKGHETTQVIGKESLPFSDREEVRRVLNGH